MVSYDHLSPLAQEIGRYMAERCPDGLPGHFDDGIIDIIPGSDRKSVALALAELEAEGLVSLSHVIGPHLPRVRTTTALFVACDAAITGHDPVEDSVVLARMLIDNPRLGGNARNLEQASTWERRRFNPAFALIVPSIADGRVRKSIQNEYPTMGIIIVDEDIVELRRYVARHTR
ncbi:MAG: hypothetical protein ABI193_26240 [Minicystis sp.]